MGEGRNRVLITGATGFIGSNVARRLVADGAQVGIFKRASSDVSRLGDAMESLTAFDVDLTDGEAVRQAVRSFTPDAILHLAMHYAVDHAPADVPKLVGTNVLGAINLLDAALELPDVFFVNTSTFFVYRESRGPVREDAPLGPFNLYSLTKIHAEEACGYFSDHDGLRVATLRLSAPYGPADHVRRIIPFLVKSYLRGESPEMTSGEQRWDYVFIEDVVDAYAALLKTPTPPGRHEIFNIGSGEVVSAREIGDRLAAILNATTAPRWGATPQRPHEVMFRAVDIGKAREILGWGPRVRIFNEGLAKTAEWFQRQFREEGTV